jgi:hypothetical protein
MHSPDVYFNDSYNVHNNSIKSFVIEHSRYPNLDELFKLEQRVSLAEYHAKSDHNKPLFLKMIEEIKYHISASKSTVLAASTYAMSHFEYDNSTQFLSTASQQLIDKHKSELLFLSPAQLINNQQQQQLTDTLVSNNQAHMDYTSHQLDNSYHSNPTTPNLPLAPLYLLLPLPHSSCRPFLQTEQTTTKQLKNNQKKKLKIINPLQLMNNQSPPILHPLLFFRTK